MPSTKANALILASALVASVAYARVFHNMTGNDETVIGGSASGSAAGGAEEVPWPGVAWLQQLAGDSSNAVTLNGEIFTSAYDAILHADSPETNAVKNFNTWINSFVIPHSLAQYILAKTNSAFYAHYIVTYIRNLVSGLLVYYSTGAFFHYHCYIHPRSKEIFKNRKRPEWSLMLSQMRLATASMFIYVMLPGVSEFIIEEGYSKCVYTIEEMGGFGMYLLGTFCYFVLVEIGIYWMHRTLHTNKTLYKYIHMPHHQYSAAEELTPWASVAFHPIDGMLQASPYVLCLPIAPTHYFTHTAMIFFTAIWATYIHDSMDWNLDPIMGSKYHTVHHTHYIYNYGQIFIFCDWIWGTLRRPMTKTGIQGQRVRLQVVKGVFGSGRGGKAKSQ